MSRLAPRDALGNEYLNQVRYRAMFLLCHDAQLFKSQRFEPDVEHLGLRRSAILCFPFHHAATLQIMHVTVKHLTNVAHQAYRLAHGKSSR